MTVFSTSAQEDGLDPATPAPVADKAGRRTVSRPTSPPNGPVGSDQALSGRPAAALPLLDITNATASLAPSERGLPRCASPPGLIPRREDKSEASSTAVSSVNSSPRLALTAPPATPTTSAPPASGADESGHCCGGDISPRQRAREGLAELGIECNWEESDQFYMYVYKVMLCPKKYSHEWSACPFAHKGERATRRDPRHIFYSATSCPDFKSGPCPRGDHCHYSHGVFEACLHPERYRTQLCNSGHNCKRSVCFFAHTLAELRTPTCQPVPPQPPAPSPPPPQLPNPGLLQHNDLLAQLLALNTQPQPQQHVMSAPPTANSIQELAARMLLGKGAAQETQHASSEDVLRAQLAQYQQTVNLMTSLLSGGGGSTAPSYSHMPQQHQQSHAAPVMSSRGGVADLLAQLQNQQMFPAMHQQPVFSMPMATQKMTGKCDVDKLAVDMETGMKITNLSPRTPFEAPVISPASLNRSGSQVSLLGQQQAQHQTPVYSTPAPSHRANYRLFPEEMHYEDRLPTNLMESL